MQWVKLSEQEWMNAAMAWPIGGLALPGVDGVDGQGLPGRANREEDGSATRQPQRSSEKLDILTFLNL